MAQLKFIGLFTVSHGGNWNQQGGPVPLMWSAAHVVVWRHFHVTGWNFEEILLKKTLKRFSRCDGWLFVCAKLV